MQTLNPQQREAVLAVDGPVLVVAGPGTGKTRTLTVRLGYLLSAHRVSPQRLLAVTFTTRAAREMATRLRQAVGEPAERICLGTFHSVCLQLLQSHGDCLDLAVDFGVCDRRDQLTLVDDILRQFRLRQEQSGAQQILKALSLARNQSLDPESALATQGLLEIYRAYRKRLRKHGLLDFDDLLTLSVTLLESFPDIRERVCDQYAYISVDEYQDVNPLQYRFLRLVAGPRPSLWVVGDADQAIYAFRGAEVENFLRFEQDFPGSRVIRLEQGYRSSPQIVTAANQVITHNTTRMSLTLRTDNPAGPPIRLVSLPDEKAEAAWVVREIEEHVGGTSHYQHYKGRLKDTVSQRQRSFRDFAILFRLNALSKPLQEALARSGIPYRSVGGNRVFDRKAVTDLMAYLRVVRRPDDDISLGRILNIPPRGLGAQTRAALQTESERRGVPLCQILQKFHNLPTLQTKTVKELLGLLQELRDNMAGQPLSQFVAWVLEASGLQRWRTQQDPRHENDFLLIRSLAAQHDDVPTSTALERFLADAALTRESDEYDSAADAVTLMTLHSAKGLEFTEVFLCGIEADILPYSGADLAEERRLFYVGLTRARERLHLLSCRQRFLFGERHERPPSRFLSEFDHTYVEKTVIADRARQPKDAERTEQLSLL